LYSYNGSRELCFLLGSGDPPRRFWISFSLSDSFLPPFTEEYIISSFFQALTPIFKFNQHIVTVKKNLVGAFKKGASLNSSLTLKAKIGPHEKLTHNLEISNCEKEILQEGLQPILKLA